MDQFMADVTDIPEAEEGDQVTLIGRDGEECITVEELAALSGGFHYEIICQIGKRVPRVYLRDGKVIGKRITLTIFTRASDICKSLPGSKRTSESYVISVA